MKLWVGSSYNNKIEDGSVVQLVEYLVSTYGVPGWTHSCTWGWRNYSAVKSTLHSQVTVLQAYNPNTWEAEAGRSQ